MDNLSQQYLNRLSELKDIQKYSLKGINYPIIFSRSDAIKNLQINLGLNRIRNSNFDEYQSLMDNLNTVYNGREERVSAAKHFNERLSAFAKSSGASYFDTNFYVFGVNGNKPVDSLVPKLKTDHHILNTDNYRRYNLERMLEVSGNLHALE